MTIRHDILSSADSVKPTGGGTPANALGVTKRMLQLPLDAYQTDVTECPVCAAPLESSKGLGPHVYHNHSDIHTMTERIRADFETDPAKVLRALHQGAGLTVQQISQRFAYNRDELAESFDLLDIDRDTRLGLRQLWDDRPDEGQGHAAENASLGAAGREQNGMAGVTGQDHPNWRGGKSTYDAVKKQLRPAFWTAKDDVRERADGRCKSCGDPQPEGGSLDVHHIVPIMCGGTNGDWNLMALCPSCHHTAEWYTRRIPEMEPVLTE